MACAASSITASRCFFATAITASMSAICPYKCTGIIAFVRAVTAASSLEPSLLNVTGSISTNTALAPTRAMAPTVAKNV